MMGQPMKMRQTNITHQPDGTVLTHAIEVDTGKGGRPMSTDTCRT
jgi:hypothetical protein